MRIHKYVEIKWHAPSITDRTKRNYKGDLSSEMNEDEGTACQNLENVRRAIHKDILSLRILHLVYLTCMDILPVCISVQPRVCLIPLEAKRLYWSPW